MISGWRISKDRYASPPSAAFDGEGSRRRGGRWSGPGLRVAYASSTIALAALEYFVNLLPQDAPEDLVALRVDIPDRVRVDYIDLASLPTYWRDRPYPTNLQDIGNNWLKSKASVYLVVPSVVIPQENNLLLNPEHIDLDLWLSTNPTASFLTTGCGSNRIVYSADE